MAPVIGRFDGASEPDRQRDSNPEEGANDRRSRRSPRVPEPRIEWEMARSDARDAEGPSFNAIWNTIKTWDVNVPSVYGGYCGANGNHVRAIFDALNASNT